MLAIWYTHITQQITGAAWQNYLAQVPEEMQAKVQRFRRWEDAHLSLFGKLLLVKALKDWGYSGELIESLTYSDYQRPELSVAELDFNITHSGHVVACALAKGQKIGIDVEENKPIELDDFKNIWRADEWAAITTAADKFAMFYHLWTCKEAVIKADGKGMSLPLKDIHIGQQSAQVKEQTWYLQPLTLVPGYPGHLSSDKPITSSPDIRSVRF